VRSIAGGVLESGETNMPSVNLLGGFKIPIQPHSCAFVYQRFSTLKPKRWAIMNISAFFPVHFQYTNHVVLAVATFAGTKVYLSPIH
jgi:hypothetical protein